MFFFFLKKLSYSHTFSVMNTFYINFHLAICLAMVKQWMRFWRPSRMSSSSPTLPSGFSISGPGKVMRIRVELYKKTRFGSDLWEKIRIRTRQYFLRIKADSSFIIKEFNNYNWQMCYIKYVNQSNLYPTIIDCMYTVQSNQIL